MNERNIEMSEGQALKKVTGYFVDGVFHEAPPEPDRRCLAQKNNKDDIAVDTGGGWLFEDGSTLDYGGQHISRPRPGGEYPLALPSAIRKYWQMRFEAAVKEFDRLKYNIERMSQESMQDVSQIPTSAFENLKALKNEIEMMAGKIKEQDKEIERIKPTKLEEPQEPEWVREAKHRFRKKLKSLELNV